MQILELVLYGNNGEKRTLAFNVGRVNIITGKSKSGKSAVGDIIEYCMGGESCNVAEGVVRESVAWYGLLLQSGSKRLFVARENPKPGRQCTSHCHYEVGGVDLHSPSKPDFESNADVGAVERALTGFAGISENIHTPDAGETRRPLEANIRHALFYCFQSQDEVAARSLLFHRQNELFIAQAIKDTLPYFLGAVSDDEISLMAQRRELNRELTKLKKKISDVKATNDTGANEAISLLAEAESVGLVSNLPNLEAWGFDLLYQTLSDIKLEQLAYPEEMTEKLKSLQDRLRHKEEELSDIRSSIDDAEAVMQVALGYGSEVQHQKARLESIGLFEKLDLRDKRCPFCSGELDPEPPGVAAMKNSIRELDEAINAVEKDEPRLQRFTEEMQQKASNVRAEISALKAQIKAIYGQMEDEREIDDLNTRRAKVYGRISYWLEKVTCTHDAAELEDERANLEARLSSIDEIVGNENVKERVDSALSIISRDMTEWAKDLEMEFAGSPYRIDMGKVTVVVDRDRPTPLREMGSASNWLGAHLIAIFGLRKFFADRNRPVPGFLFLDQPSQVYFPEKSKSEGDVDIEAITRVYDFIEQRVSECNGKLQVIVVDHARLDTDYFKQDTVEDWRDDGKNLVPVEWYRHTD